MPDYDRLWTIVNEYVTEADREGPLRTLPGVIVTGLQPREFVDRLNSHRDALVFTPAGVKVVQVKTGRPGLVSAFLASRKGPRAAIELVSTLTEIPRSVDPHLELSSSVPDVSSRLDFDATFVTVTSTAGTFAMWADTDYRSKSELEHLLVDFRAWNGRGPDVSDPSGTA